MSGPQRDGRPYLGYRDADRRRPWAEWFRPGLGPLPAHVVEAVAVGPRPEPLLTDLDDLQRFVDADEQVEDGLARGRDGSLRVAVHTPMPDVTPAMWDWWFGWHGDEPSKYKLWHPQAHLFAQWADGDGVRPGTRSYVGRTSYVDEYLGSRLARAAIRFVPPDEVGIDAAALDRAGATAVCARVGLSDQPIDIGWLVHHVRGDDAGSEMRSRFWLGGRHVALRTGSPRVRRVAAGPLARVGRLSVQDAADLLVHCAQEMHHLAAILPGLHARFA